MEVQKETVGAFCFANPEVVTGQFEIQVKS